MSQFQVNLINLSNPHDQTIYSYNTSTLIVDLHQQLAQKSDHGNVQIYFTQNQPFKGNLNRYLHQNIKESSIYYNLNVSQIQTPSVQSLMNTQENKKQLIISGLQNQNSSQSILGSSYQSKSEKLCQTDDESFLQSNGNQQINQEQIYQLQSKVQDLNAILKQKEEEMQKTMYENEILSKDLQNQNEKNNQIILDLNRQNDDLKDQLTQLSRKAQLDEKNIENLKTQIEQLKIENESKNIITHQIMQLNDNHFYTLYNLILLIYIKIQNGLNYQIFIKYENSNLQIKQLIRDKKIIFLGCKNSKDLRKFNKNKINSNHKKMKQIYCHLMILQKLIKINVDI